MKLFKKGMPGLLARSRIRNSLHGPYGMAHVKEIDLLPTTQVSQACQINVPSIRPSPVAEPSSDVDLPKRIFTTTTTEP
jgi:hypothetical protein